MLRGDPEDRERSGPLAGRCPGPAVRPLQPPHRFGFALEQLRVDPGHREIALGIAVPRVDERRSGHQRDFEIGRNPGEQDGGEGIAQRALARRTAADLNADLQRKAAAHSSSRGRRARHSATEPTKVHIAPIRIKSVGPRKRSNTE